MNTTSPKSTVDYLRSYSLDVECWDEDMGDSDQMLGHREVLHAHLAELSDAEHDQLMQLDARVTALAGEHSDTPGWDAVMLRKTAELIERERSVSALKHAA